MFLKSTQSHISLAFLYKKLSFWALTPILYCMKNSNWYFMKRHKCWYQVCVLHIDILGKDETAAGDALSFRLFNRHQGTWAWWLDSTCDVNLSKVGLGVSWQLGPPWLSHRLTQWCWLSDLAWYSQGSTGFHKSQVLFITGFEPKSKFLLHQPREKVSSRCSKLWLWGHCFFPCLSPSPRLPTG